MSGVATTAPGPAVVQADEAHQSPVPEAVRSAYDYMPATLAGYMAGIGVVSLLYWAITPMTVMLPWLAVFAVIWLSRAWTARQFRHAPSPGVAGPDAAAGRAPRSRSSPTARASFATR